MWNRVKIINYPPVQYMTYGEFDDTPYDKIRSGPFTFTIIDECAYIKKPIVDIQPEQDVKISDIYKHVMNIKVNTITFVGTHYIMTGIWIPSYEEYPVEMSIPIDGVAYCKIPYRDMIDIYTDELKKHNDRYEELVVAFSSAIARNKK
jgi:hypothetical protein